MKTFFIVLLIMLAFAGILYLALRLYRRAQEAEQRRAGRNGEILATAVIEGVLRRGDVLLTNLSLEYDGKPTELDNLVVNSYGVFIIEVKNYVGELYGAADDFEWTKEKTTEAGNTYEKPVKNPLKQVNRQVYILSHYLKSRGIDVWVEGYAFLIQGRSPIKTPQILLNQADVNRAIHTPGENRPDPKTREKIVKLFS